MNEPQVWTLIGVFAAVCASLITLVLHTVNKQFDGLRNEMNAKFEKVDARFDGQRNEFNARFDGLDRDVQALTNRVFGSDRP